MGANRSDVDTSINTSWGIVPHLKGMCRRVSRTLHVGCHWTCVSMYRNVRRRNASAMCSMIQSGSYWTAPKQGTKTQYVLKIKKYLDVSGSPRGFKHQQWPTKYYCRIFRQFNQEGLTMTQKRSQQLYNTNRCMMYNVSWRKRSIWIYKKEAHVRDKYVILCARVQHIRKYCCVADGVEPAKDKASRTPEYCLSCAGTNH